MTDWEKMILDSIPGATLEKKYQSLQKLLKKKDKVKMISFEDSDIYDKKVFVEKFLEWPKDKCKFYYESADAYSAQGNKYINWEKAIKNWASRDDLQGKYKWATDNGLNGLVL